MNFDLADEHELIRRTVRDFAEQRVAPVAEENSVRITWRRSPRVAANREASRSTSAAGGTAGDPAVALATAQRLLNACEVSRETFDDEMDTAPMRLTITRGAAVAAKAVGAGVGDRWPLVAPVFGAMGGFLRAGHGTHQLCESGLKWVGTRGGRLKSAFASLRGASAQAVRQIGTAGLLEGRGKGDAGL